MRECVRVAGMHGPFKKKIKSQKAFGAIRFSQLLLLLLIHGAKQQAFREEEVTFVSPGFGVFSFKRS